MRLLSNPLPSSFPNGFVISVKFDSPKVKNRPLILAVVLLCVGSLMVSSIFQGSRRVPPVNMGFVGFTNSGARTEALFAISNPPNAAVSLHSVRLRDTSDSNSADKDRGHFSWARRESWGLPYAITVDTTNEPLSVIFKFQQRSVGPARIVEQIKELFGRITGSEVEFFTGHVFFATNDTRVGTALH